MATARALCTGEGDEGDVGWHEPSGESGQVHEEAEAGAMDAWRSPPSTPVQHLETWQELPAACLSTLSG